MSAPRRSARLAAKAAVPVTPVKAPKHVVVPSAPIKSSTMPSVFKMSPLVGRYEPLKLLQTTHWWFDTQFAELPTSAEARKEARKRISDVCDDAYAITRLMTSFKDEIATRKNLMEVFEYESTDPAVLRYHQVVKKEEERRIDELSQLYDTCEDLAIRFMDDLWDAENVLRFNVLGQDFFPQTTEHIAHIRTLFNSIIIHNYLYD